MLPSVVLALLAVLPSAAPTYVNCNIACRKCKERNTSQQIYCAMCKECRVRLRERALKAYRRNLMDDGIIDVDGLEPDKPGRQLPGYDENAVRNDEAVINMGAPVDNLELVDEPPGGEDDGFMENTDAVVDDPDDKLILQNVVTQPNTPQTPAKALVKLKTTSQYWPEVTHVKPVLLENPMENFPEDSMENFQEVPTMIPSLNPPDIPIHIPEGCPTPPVCESDLEDELPEASEQPTTTTPPPPLPTTCPPVPTCKPKRKRPTIPHNMPCMPCMPWCPGPCNNQNMWNQWNPWNQENPNGSPGPWPPGPWSTGSLGPRPPGSLGPTSSSSPEEPEPTTPAAPAPEAATPAPKITTCVPVQTTCCSVQPAPEACGPVQTASTTTQDFIYVYVGVPKEIQ